MATRSLAFLGTGLAWAFAAMLAHAAVHPELTVFEGFHPLRLFLTLAFVAGCAVYWLWLRAAERSLPPATDFARSAAPAAPLLAAALASPPISSDPLLYLHYGSMALAGENPYLVRSSAFESAFSGSVVWDLTCPYGPLSLALFALAALAKSAIWGVLALKLAWLGAHVLGAYACFRADPERRTLLARAFLFNPILLLAYVIDAHVDALMAALLLIGCLALTRDRPRLALLGFAAATLTKAIALPALALWFAWTLSRRRYALALSGAAALAGVAVALAGTLLPTATAWQSLTAPVANTGRSVQHVLALVGPMLGFDGTGAAATYTWAARAGFVIAAAALWFAAARSPAYTASVLARDFALLWLGACLFVVPFVPWWYGALAIAAVLFSKDAAALRPVALVYGCCSAVTLSAGSGLSRAGLVGALLAIAPASVLLLRALRGARHADSQIPSMQSPPAHSLPDVQIAPSGERPSR